MKACFIPVILPMKPLKKGLNDSAVAELAKLDHVTSVSPEYDMSVLLLKGGYEGWAEWLL